MNKVSIIYGFGLIFFLLLLIKVGNTQSTIPLIDSPGKTIGSDFNGDGIHDFMAGAFLNNDGASDAGAAYVFFGASNLGGTTELDSGTGDVEVFGKAGSDGLGLALSTAGDINGDGFDDFIIGSYLDNGAANDAGAAFIFFGASGLSGSKFLGGAASADLTILGKAGSDQLGGGVSKAGDVNGDGFDDFIVGARLNGDAAGNAGAAYVFYGADNLSGTKSLGGAASADVTILGKAGSDQLGTSVSGAGDVNGDGFDDILVGARNNADVAADAGAAYIFFGASNLSGTKSLGAVESADVTILGKAGSDFLGELVSGAGDVNGDGFDDIMVGARQNGDAAATAGAAYIFFGASDVSGTKSLGAVASANVTILGKAGGDELGFGISGVGDINDDGFDDIMVGARNNDDAADTAGAAYIFFGASDLSGTKSLGAGESADVTILGKAGTDRLGTAVSGIGDVNGDGFADIVVGAYTNAACAAGTCGTVYVFFGASNLSGTKSLGGAASADLSILGKGNTDRFGRAVGGGSDSSGP